MYSMNNLKAGRPSRKEKAIISVQKTLKNTTRMNINLPKYFHKMLKQKALDENSSITDLVKKALGEYMSK